MRTSIVTDALEMAKTGGFFSAGHPLGVVFHTDRGSQYTSDDVEKWATRNHVTLSCGEVGVCWDCETINPSGRVAESFIATLKNEMYYQTVFPTRAQARTAVAEYIEVYCNRKRLHSTLGYLTPLDAHRAAHRNQADETPAA